MSADPRAGLHTYNKVTRNKVARASAARPVAALALSFTLGLVIATAQAQTTGLPGATDLSAHHTGYCVRVIEQDGRGDALPYACLNAELAQTAQSAHPADARVAASDVLGNAEPNTLGTFSYTGESIRMGSNFGKSAFPERPAQPVYTNTLPAGGK